jgi:hypothetical protein
MTRSAARLPARRDVRDFNLDLLGSAPSMNYVLRHREFDGIAM